MPPTGQPAIDFSNISDADLSQMLKDYGIDVGPVNVATRKTYERKLVQLKTGSLPPSKHQPAADDDDEDDDQEVQVKKPEALRKPVQDLTQPAHSYASSVRDSDFSASKSYASSVRDSDFTSSRPYASSVRDSDFTSSRPYVSSVRDSDFSASKSYAYSARHTDASPEIRSRPSLPADRQTPSSYTTPVRRPLPAKVPQVRGNSIPLWLKLLAVAVAVILIYLIYINMEPAAVSNIPEIQSKFEV